MLKYNWLRQLIISIGFVFAALATAILLFRSSSPPPSPSDTPEQQLRARLPDADPLLIHRVATNWGYTGLKAAEKQGESGLVVLEAFEDEAAYCLEHDPDAFASLAKVVQLDPVRFRLATGPWNRAVIDWAQDKKLERFLERLHQLSPERLGLAEATPSALPLLLCETDTPIARAMLERHGERVWRLFMAVNFADHPEDLERVALAVEQEGDLILQLNDNFGLPYALLLVPPETGKGSKHFPEVVKYALRTLEDTPAALALMMTNYDTIMDLLNTGKSLRQVEEAIELFRSLPPVVQEVAIDHKQTLRLLSESWHGQKLGAIVLRRCGPGAADLVYDRYSSDEKLKWPALLGMARLGETGYQVFYRYRDYGKFHTLLRRSEAELMNPRENPPVLVHAIYNIARQGQDTIDIYADPSVRNLKGQVLADVRGPLAEEAYLEWVPGYIVYRTAANYADGRHVTGGDVFWASVDAVSTATILYGPVVNGLKSVGSKVGQEAATLAVKEGITQTERTLAQQGLRQLEKGVGQSMEKLALQTLKREGAELARFGDNAGNLALRRLESRTKGLALELTDRRQQYIKLAQGGDINGKARLVEEIGEEGARKYAKHVGYEPLLDGKPGKGMGFDQVYRDGNRIKVIEAKGGSSPLKTYRGREQGTIEYTKEVAEWTISSPSTRAEEKEAAREVLKAAGEGRLDVEVVRTEHVQGRPGAIRVEQLVTSSGQMTLSIDEARMALLHAPGMAKAWVRNAGATEGTLELRGWLKQADAVAHRSGITLWSDGSGPLTPRKVTRKGSPIVIPVQHLPAPGEGGFVSDFAIAILERGL